MDRGVLGNLGEFDEFPVGSRLNRGRINRRVRQNQGSTDRQTCRKNKSCLGYPESHLVTRSNQPLRRNWMDRLETTFPLASKPRNVTGFEASIMIGRELS